MKITYSKTKISTITLVLVLTIAAIFVTGLPTVTATDIDLFAFITAAPNPIGVEQTTTILFWLDRPTPTATAGFVEGNWEGLMLRIEDPSGNIENSGPYYSDASGGAYLLYMPTKIGIYTLEFTFPGQTFGDDYYKPTSATVTLTVQEEPIEHYQTPPLPTGYWDRPIYGENKDWWKISGNWLMPGYYTFGSMQPKNFNPYTTAPTTAHIVWTKESHMGGIVGGERYQDRTYYLAPSYQYYWTPLAMGGKLYYPQRLTPGDNWIGIYCYDLSTGEEEWFQPSSKGYGSGGGGGGTTPTMVASLLDYDGPNAHGVLPYLWNIGTTYSMFDANSGEPILNATGAPAMGYLGVYGLVTGPVLMFDEMGSLLAYYMDPVGNWLCMWNSTKLVESAVGFTNVYIPPVGATLDWNTGIEWNVSIPARGTGFNLGYPGVTDDVILAYSASILTGGGYESFVMTAYSTEDGHELWWKNITDPLSPLGSQPYLFFGPTSDGIFTIWRRQTMQWFAFDTHTGNQLWGPTEPYENAWDQYAYGNIAYGKLYVSTGSGRLYCHDLETGDLEWTFETPPSGFSTPYGNEPFIVQYPTIADGKIFIANQEHTPNNPYYYGSRMYCVDAITGQGVWNVSGWWAQYYAGVTPIIVDGYLLSQNCMDGKIYCFGKGQTATTVEAPLTAVSLGSSLMIRGTITDQSPAAEGTPCIADQYMTDWMEYLHMQKSMPNANGVEIVLETFDPNGNYYEIGRVTSDAAGMFKLMWEPPVPGEYTIIARFEGTESYWSSFAETAIGVTEAPSPVGQMEPEPTTPTEAPLITTEIAIIAAVAVAAVIGIAAYWTLRKRK